MSRADAQAYFGSVYLGENMKDLHHIVIDCDGDHNGLHLETIKFLYKYREMTHCLSKPKQLWEYGEELPQDADPWMTASFHLTFMTDRWIPTMHFPKAHIDIVGNHNNSLRYWKNKTWNHRAPLQLTEEIWNDIRQFVERSERG